MKITIVSIIIAVAFVFAPLTTSAITTQELQAQIQSLLTLITQLQQQLKTQSTQNPVTTVQSTEIFTNTRDNYQITQPRGVKLSISSPNNSENPVFIGSASEIGYISAVNIYIYNGTIDQTKKAFADSYKQQTITFGQDIPMTINGNLARKVTAYYSQSGGNSTAYYIQYEPNRTLIVYASEEVAKSVKTLQKQGGTIPITTTQSTATTSQTCPNFYRNLWVGSRGSDVANLQRFLKLTGDFNYPEITYYFGPATQRAVQKWQARNGVISYGTPSSTGYGVVGPATRAKIARVCGGVVAGVRNLKDTTQLTTKRISITKSGKYTIKIPSNWISSSISSTKKTTRTTVGGGFEDVYITYKSTKVFDASGNLMMTIKNPFVPVGLELPGASLEKTSLSTNIGLVDKLVLSFKDDSNKGTAIYNWNKGEVFLGDTFQITVPIIKYRNEQNVIENIIRTLQISQ